MAPLASIVINTYNRAESLERTLESLRYLDYPDFEVVVVNGPSDDDTEELLRKWEEDIKIGSCTETNLSVSRNIGIAMAAGEVVAFIDDDAIPEPEWLSRIMAGYDSDEVGGVGGSTYDHTGHEFQTRYIINDRFGGTRKGEDINPTTLFNFPNANEFCGFLGTNASFRRDVLLHIGGFDEEFDCYLDETDVCVRMIDSGHIAKCVDDAYIHHKFLPSNVRNENRIVTNWYSLVKNKAYFSVKNASLTHTFSEITEQVFEYIDSQRYWIELSIKDQLVTESTMIDFDETIERALKDGFERGLNQPRKLLSQETLKHNFQPFNRFPMLLDALGQRLTICYLSYYFPPGFYGGIARFTHDLSRGIAEKGHNVHVITAGKDHDTVDFEEGVWVHRIVPRAFDLPDIPADFHVCRNIHNWARTAYEEVKRIEQHHHIDIIEAPIWGSEGLYCIRDDIFRNRTIVSLHTTTKIAAESYDSWQKSRDIQRVIETEDYVLRNARVYLANSKDIVNCVRQAYSIDFADSDIGLVPHGAKDLSSRYVASGDSNGFTKVLFVGRFEHRKGVDILLNIIPSILQRHSHVKFILIGDDSIPVVPNVPGPTYKTEFLNHHEGEKFLERIEFKGLASEAILYQHYAECDIFVAPSRYESFGLIFLEAMMFGKPVVGCAAGGMPEIIEDGGNGFLALPGDKDSLEKAIELLVTDPPLRDRFGKRSRRLYEERFTDERMVNDILDIYYRVIEGNSENHPMSPLDIINNNA